MPRDEHDVTRRLDALNRVHVSVVVFLEFEYWKITVANEQRWWLKFHDPPCKRSVAVTDRAENSLRSSGWRLCHRRRRRDKIAELQFALGRPFPKRLAVVIIGDDIEFERRIRTASGSVPVTIVPEIRDVLLWKDQVVNLRMVCSREPTIFFAVAIIDVVFAVP